MAGMAPSRFGFVLVIAAVSLVGCEGERSGGEDQDARPGLIQVGSVEGPLLDEAEACERLHTALLTASERLECSTSRVPACPDLVRPAGTAACTRFSEESIEACEDQLSDYESCEDFTRRRCFVVSVLDQRSEGCLPEAGVDGGTDAGGPDAGLDGGSDAGISPEAGLLDAGSDASAPLGDAGLTDAGTGVDPDASTDAGQEPASPNDAAVAPTDPSAPDAAPSAPDASADGG